MKGFTLQHVQKRIVAFPREDSFLFDEKERLIAVADGVTRDPFVYLPDIKKHWGKLIFALAYKRPSPAKVASSLFCDTFVKVMRDYRDRDERAVREAFHIANENIGDWNYRHNPYYDYLMRDLAGCTAVGASEKEQDDCVTWGYICDAGLALFDKEGNLKARTENDGPDKHDPFIWSDERLKKIKGDKWRNPEARYIVRHDYRNSGKENTFGVLTGEEAAMSYVKTGTWERKPGDVLFVYSDGLEHVIFSDEFADMIRKRNFAGIRRLCRERVKTEGSLVWSL